MDNIICPFAKTIISTRCACQHSTRYCVAERVSAACDSTSASADCMTLVQLLRENARFALGMTDTSGSLTFGKELKILYGGLAGLQALITPGASDPGKVANIYALVGAAYKQYGTLGDIPYQHIVKSIAAYKPVRRGRLYSQDT